MRKTSDEKAYIHGKMMSFSDLFFEYCKLEDENEKLKAENKKLKGTISDPIKENKEYFEIKMYKYKRKYEICKKKLELIMLYLEEVKEVLNEKDC